MKALVSGFVTFVSFIASILSICQVSINYFIYDISDINWFLVVGLVLLFTSLAVIASQINKSPKFHFIPQVYSLLYFLFAMIAYVFFVYSNAFVELDANQYITSFVLFLIPLFASIVVTNFIEYRPVDHLDFFSKTLLLLSFCALLPIGYKYIYLMAEVDHEIKFDQVFSELLLSVVGSGLAIFISKSPSVLKIKNEVSQ